MKLTFLPISAFLLAACLASNLAKAENQQFRERMAAWQSPHGSSAIGQASFEEEPAALRDEFPPHSTGYIDESVDSWNDAPHGQCLACDPCDNCDGNWDWCGNNCGPRLWWLRRDGLLFWRKGRDLPVLVTTSTVPVPPPGSEILLGGETEDSVARIGGRIDLGTWLGYSDVVGVGGRFWGLENERGSFTLSSAELTNQTIERPFILSPDTPNSLVIADPFTGFGGNIAVSSSSEVFGADIYVRFCCGRDGYSRTDFVTGYQFSRINESLRIQSDTQNGTLIVTDDWATRNEFHGGILGMLHETDCGCWSIQLTARVALGSMRQTAIVRGSTNGQAGGLLVEADGTQVRDRFTAAPEAGVNFACRISPCTQLHAGYSFMHWSNVARPEEIIDNVRGDGVSLVFRDSSFWVQGFNAGLTYTW